MVLERFGINFVRNLSMILTNHVEYPFHVDSKELFARVDSVDLRFVQFTVPRNSQGRSIRAIDHHVNIVWERNRSISEFVNAFLRSQAACHADLEHALPKGTNIRDHVHISSLRFWAIEMARFNFFHLASRASSC